MAKTKLKVEYVPIDTIKAYPNNAKLHPAEQIEQIKKSIQEFGFRDPVAVWNGEIVEGHGRIIAATELGITDIPIIRLDDMTDEERRAYALVHNKLTMNTGFDFAILDMELEDLKQFEFDMTDFGFEDQSFGIDNIDDLFEDAEPKDKEPKQIQCPHCGQWFTP